MTDRLDNVNRNLTAERFGPAQTIAGITQSQARKLAHEVAQYAEAARRLAVLGATMPAVGHPSPHQRAALVRAKQTEHTAWLAVRGMIADLIADTERTGRPL